MEKMEFLVAKVKEDLAKKEEFSGSPQKALELYLEAAHDYEKYAVRMAELMDVEGKGEDPVLKLAESTGRAIECLINGSFCSNNPEERKEILKKANILLKDMKNVLKGKSVPPNSAIIKLQTSLDAAIDAATGEK